MSRVSLCYDSSEADCDIHWEFLLKLHVSAFSGIWIAAASLMGDYLRPSSNACGIFKKNHFSA